VLQSEGKDARGERLEAKVEVKVKKKKGPRLEERGWRLEAES
jgi:hypothetical protein